MYKLCECAIRGQAHFFQCASDCSQSSRRSSNHLGQKPKMATCCEDVVTDPIARRSCSKPPIRGLRFAWTPCLDGKQNCDVLFPDVQTCRCAVCPCKLASSSFSFRAATYEVFEYHRSLEGALFWVQGVVRIQLAPCHPRRPHCMQHARKTPHQPPKSTLQMSRAVVQAETATVIHDMATHVPLKCKPQMI